MSVIIFVDGAFGFIFLSNCAIFFGGCIGYVFPVGWISVGGSDKKVTPKL